MDGFAALDSFSAGHLGSSSVPQRTFSPPSLPTTCGSAKEQALCRSRNRHSTPSCGAKTRETLFEFLHDQFRAAIMHTCLFMLRDRHDAEDAVQETFLKAYTLLDSVTRLPRQAQLPWLYRIATHVCLHSLRTRRRKGFNTTEGADTLSITQAWQHDRVVARDLLARAALELDHRDQQIVVGLYVDGMTQEEIAQSLAISRRAVVKRLTKLRQRLRAVWAASNEG